MEVGDAKPCGGHSVVSVARKYFVNHIMNATQRWALCALLFGAALSARAQDEIVLGSPPPAAAGQVVSVPVFLSHVGGSPIHWIDLSITHSRPDLISGCLGTTYPNCELQFETAGKMAVSTPETSSTLTNIDSLFVRRIFGAALSFTPGQLDLIGFIKFRLAPNPPSSGVIRLKFDSKKTFLANHDGTIIDGELTLTGTSVEVELCVDPPKPPCFDFFGPVSGCSSTSGLCRAGEDVEFTMGRPIDACETATWYFGDGTVVSTNGSTVRHRFTLPGVSSLFATYTVIATVTRASGSAAFVRQVSIHPGCSVTTVPDASAAVGMPVLFTADTVPPGLPAFVTWKFGDGTFGSGNPIQHAYPFGGTYQWEAEVSIAGTEIPCVVKRLIQVSGPSPQRVRVVRR
jgi:hypothetical protein